LFLYEKSLKKYVSESDSGCVMNFFCNLKTEMPMVMVFLDLT